MEHVLSERTTRVEREGEPTKYLRAPIGQPTKSVTFDDEYEIQVEIQGPDEGDALNRVFRAGDAWQAVRFAFRLVYDQAYSRVRTGSRLTFENRHVDQIDPCPQREARVGARRDEGREDPVEPRDEPKGALRRRKRERDATGKRIERGARRGGEAGQAGPVPGKRRIRSR
jgi:hypothetical protein